MKYEKICGIYKITNMINGKSYIGQSKDIQRRISEHKSEIYRNCFIDKILYKAISKYGVKNFTFEIIEECVEKDLDSREIYWINFYDTLKNGYNCTIGGKSFPMYDHSESASSHCKFEIFDGLITDICKSEDTDSIQNIDGIDENFENLSTKEARDYYCGLQTMFKDFCGGYNSFEDWAECNL